MNSFFVSCALGLEQSLLKELTEKSFLFLGNDGRPNTKPFRLISEEPGGLLFEAELLIGLQIPLFSKLANRVLVRIAQGKTVEFFQLENLIKKLDQKLGRENYAITSVGSYFDLNKNYQCGQLILDEDATIYRQFINSSPTPGSIFSICMKDYSPALKAMEKFISTSISMRYEVDLQEGERISDVTLWRGNVFQRLNTYDIQTKKNVIQFNQRMLKEGDKLVITIRKTN